MPKARIADISLNVDIHANCAELYHKIQYILKTKSAFSERTLMLPLDSMFRKYLNSKYLHTNLRKFCLNIRKK